MKVMQGPNGEQLKVWKHFITRNFWEFYLEEPVDGVSFGLVMGDDTELGYVSIDEIKPFVASQAEPDKTEFMPAPDWKWVDITN